MNTESVGDVATFDEFVKVKEKLGYENTVVFDNIFSFISFTHKRKLTPEVSVTWFDTRKDQMYIAY